MNIKLIKEPISKSEVLEIAKEFYIDMVKGVVDIEREVIALGGEYHMDANMILIGNGSKQQNVWGFNIYPKQIGDDWIEYTSLINIRPKMGNMDMVIKNKEICDKMKKIIEKLIV
jgi:hypothetical protein